MRRHHTLPLLALGAAFLVACQDKRVKAVDTGMTRDAAIEALTEGKRAAAAASAADPAGQDSFPNIYAKERYLINGKQIEVLYFSAEGKSASKDSVPLRDLTPIVLNDGKVIGKGWTYWDSTAAAHKIPVPPKA